MTMDNSNYNNKKPKPKTIKTFCFHSNPFIRELQQQLISVKCAGRFLAFGLFPSPPQFVFTFFTCSITTKKKHCFETRIVTLQYKISKFPICMSLFIRRLIL